MLHDDAAGAASCVAAAGATEVLEFAFADDEAPLRLVCTRQREHARNNSSVGGWQPSVGDATGHRSSGGAARVLCHFLRRAAAALALHRRAVVELGCGLGLAGLYAARTAREVTLTDGDEQALALARASHSLNAHLLAAAVRFATLPWSSRATLDPLFAGAAAPGACAAIAAADAAADAAAAAAHAQLHATSDAPLLLGADLIYYADGIALLMETVAALLAASGGLAVLAANPRQCGWAQALCDAAERLGLQAHSLPVERVVPRAELAQGWFAHTRLVLLWRVGDAPPALPAGDAELLVPLARAEGLLDGHIGADALPDWAPFDGHELDGDDAAQ